MGRFADELLGFPPDGDGSPGGVHGHHGRLVEDDALRLHKDQRVGGTQIDGNVLAEHGLFFLAEGG